MTPMPTHRHDRKPLRLWPGITFAVLLGVLWYAVPAFMPDFFLYGLMGGLVCALAVLLWWAFFSRAPGFERWASFALMIVAVPATRSLIDKSIANGAMGMLFWISVIPTLSLALVAGVVASRRLAEGPRRAALAAAVLIGSGMWVLLRTDGI